MVDVAEALVGLLGEAGTGLAAPTAVGRDVRAVEHGVQVSAGGDDRVDDHGVHALEVLDGEQTLADAGLVGDHDDVGGGLRQPGQGVDGARQQLELRGRAHVVADHATVDHAVTVDEHRPAVTDVQRAPLGR